MPEINFPPVEWADEDGVLCWGGDLTPQTLEKAYRSGIFPWPHRNLPLLWFAPPERAVLQFEYLHVSSRLKRSLRNSGFEIRFDTAFGEVIRACSKPRMVEGEMEYLTWINPQIIKGFEQMHALGHAHSVETWCDGELVGGMYGVGFGGFFSGESMFHIVNDASKAALLGLFDMMQSKGVTWFDCQTLTPHMERLGAREIPREIYMEWLTEALEQPSVWA